MIKLSPAYVTGLLADLEQEVPDLRQRLAQARARAERIDAELSVLLRRLDESKSILAKSHGRCSKATFEVSERNSQVASLHQAIASLKRKSEDIKIEMATVEAVCGAVAVGDRELAVELECPRLMISMRSRMLMPRIWAIATTISPYDTNELGRTW